MGQNELDGVRTIALALPEVNERQSHGAACFFIENKRPLCYYHDDHPGEGRISLTFPVPAGVQPGMVVAAPERFFKPPTSAAGTFDNRLGELLDTSEVIWTAIAAMLVE